MFKNLVCFLIISCLLFLPLISVSAQHNKRNKKRSATLNEVKANFATHFSGFATIKPDNGIFKMSFKFANYDEALYNLCFVDDTFKLTEKHGNGPELLCLDDKGKNHNLIKLTDAVFVETNIFECSKGFCAIAIGKEVDRPPRLIFIKISKLPIKINFDEKGVLSVSWVDTYMFEARRGGTMSVRHYPWSYQRKVLSMDALLKEDDKAFQELIKELANK